MLWLIRMIRIKMVKPFLIIQSSSLNISLLARSGFLQLHGLRLTTVLLKSTIRFLLQLWWTEVGTRILMEPTLTTKEDTWELFSIKHQMARYLELLEVKLYCHLSKGNLMFHYQVKMVIQVISTIMSFIIWAHRLILITGTSVDGIFICSQNILVQINHLESIVF